MLLYTELRNYKGVYLMGTNLSDRPQIYIKDDMYAEKFLDGVTEIQECRLGGNNVIAFNIQSFESLNLLLKLFQHEKEFDLRIVLPGWEPTILRYGKIESINIKYDINVHADIVFVARDDVFISCVYYMKG